VAAKLISISDRTLRNYYRRELDTGVARANAAVAQSLFHMAVKDKVPSAAIFWLKARAGWREQQDVNIGGTDRPMQVDFTWAPALQPKPVTIDAEAAEVDDAEAGQLVVQWNTDRG
jgi:hypothetical protein